MAYMTFEEWRKTGKRVYKCPKDGQKTDPIFDDLDLEYDEVIIYGSGDSSEGYNGLIEVLTVMYMPEQSEVTDLTKSRWGKQYHLMLEKDEWITTSLYDVERKLYDWLKDEGAFDTDEEKLDRRIAVAVQNGMRGFREGVKVTFPNMNFNKLEDGVINAFEDYTHAVLKHLYDKNTEN